MTKHRYPVSDDHADEERRTVDSDNPVRVEGGHITVPTGPGLGVVPDDGTFGDPVASYS